MIVTRQRRKPFPWRRIVLPVIAILLIAFALVWPPSRSALTGGPMAPAWHAVGSGFDTIAAPFHFAAQNQVITDRNRQIATLTQQLTTAQNDAASKDKQIAAMQQQIDQLQTQAANTRAAAAPSRGNRQTANAPNPSGSTSPFSASNPSTGGVSGGDLTAGATADMRRTAQYWANMDPEAASKIVQRLPPNYAARIFALMQPDAVGAILDALPPAYAAKLTQEHPELQR